MFIGNSSLTHQERIIGAQIQGTMNAQRANREGVPERTGKASVWYRALRYRVQSEGWRSLFRK